ncbi:MAG: TolC family protein [Lewinellaceae bacterium]|nr:TolC family protein [Saprospiraceae bacterium]MCB9337418.1 TolC family protein [Lewinellaceae bacterium]
MKKLSIFLLFIFSVGFANGQGAANPELIALVQKAFDYYPRFRELEAAAQSSAIKVDMARGQRLPVVSSQATFQYLYPVAEVSFGAPGQEQTLQFQPHDNYNVALNASGLIFDFGKTKAQIEKAIAEAQISKGTLDAQRQAIAYQVAQIYYGLVFLKKSLTVQESQLKSLQANLDQVTAKHNNGDALELDLLNAQVALANAQNRKTDLLASIEKQQALLAMLSGVEHFESSAQTFDFQSAEPAATTAGNPELAVAQAKIDVAEKEIMVNKKYLRPSLNYNGGLGFRNGYQPDINEMRFNWGAGVGLTYPLYVGGRDRQQLHLSQIGLSAAQAAAEGVANSLRSEIVQAEADAKASRAKLANSATIIQQAQTALQLADVRFENGVASNTDVLTAHGNLEQAQLQSLQYEYQLCLAVLAIERLEGKRFW